ncbi:inhibitor of bruton tyrosine kinase [Plakobranchus ocellatus]|uniref:Inhibitor of bruton tyrosine kinase n=1 Tax=Plakobranchus ocellatus TaxID=259542 RepID=A0AAV4BUX5_9GAST|nr:inhibitor of bruton tyrosine kinase [Plakobranchus ocellatus]
MEQGTQSSRSKHTCNMTLHKAQSSRPELYDVTIRSEDGQETQCHKCVLVSRLEYFYSMLATGWLESSSSTTLTLPIPGQVLDIVLQFLYTDEAPQLTDCTKEDLLCNVLIVSDQLLVTRLKEMCEVSLANILSFRNVGELLEFSSVYQAQQLRSSCQQFISLNLAAMLEGRYLDVLSEETLNELSSYYRARVPSMVYRHVTPAWTGSQAILDELVAEFDSTKFTIAPSEDIPNSSGRRNNKQQQQQQRKRGKGQRRNSGDSDKIGATPTEKAVPSSGLGRNLSVSSDISGLSDEDGLAAVLEEIEKQQGNEEKKSAQGAAQAKKEKFKWKPLGQLDEARPGKPIQPEDVPHRVSNFKTLAWSTSQTSQDLSQEACATANVSLQPGSAVLLKSAPEPSTASLRDIMQQESQAEDKRKSNFSSSQRISWKDVKKQQTKEAKERQQKTVSEKVPQTTDFSPKAASNPWTPMGNMVKSFRELMVQDQVSLTSARPMEISQAPSPHSPSPTSPLAQSPLGVASAARARVTSWGSPPTSPSSGTDNPWQRRGAEANIASGSAQPNSAARVALNFSAILRDEEEKSETLARTTQKPLALIQLEEQAMSELIAHYQAQRTPGADTWDRTISVERVNKAMATPLWKRDRTTSSSGHL